MPIVIPTDQVRERLNGDHQFLRATKYWSAQLLLKVGDEGYVLEIVEGAVRRFEPGAGLFDRCTAVLGGSERDWEQLLEPVPPPFYQDFFGAFFQHDFEMAGDLDAVFSHYWALLRLLDVLRDAVGGVTSGEAAGR